MELVKPDWVCLGRDHGVIDQGTWPVLAHVYPQADIPVLQLLINARGPLEYRVTPRVS